MSNIDRLQSFKSPCSGTLLRQYKPIYSKAKKAKSDLSDCQNLKKQISRLK